MNRRYAPEMDAWLAERYPHGDSMPSLCEEFEAKFGQAITEAQMRGWASSRCVRRAVCIKWTAEMEDFLRDFIPGHSEREISDAFEKRFGHVLTESQIGNAKHRLGVRSGTHGGCFEKGHVPANKGRTWDEMGIPQKTRERMLSTAFKRGDEPVNGQRIPVGTERVGKDGYIQVKVKTMSDRPCANKCWRMKHHLVWEEANGRPVPPSTMIVFADGDKSNFDPDNLVAVPRRIWAVISHGRIPFADRDTLAAAMDIAEARTAVYAAKKRERACGACGRRFAPRHPNQRTCDACLEAGLKSPRKTRPRKEKR